MRSTAGFIMLAALFCLLGACSGGYRAPVTDVTGGPRYIDTGRQHRVNAGETLYSIAWVYDTDHRLLAQVNDLPPPYRVFPGQMLLVDVRGVTLNAEQPAIVTTGRNTGSAVTSSPATTRSTAVTVTPSITSVPLPAAGNGSQPARVETPVPVMEQASGPQVQTRPVQPALPPAANLPVSTWLWPASGQIVERFNAADNGNKGIDIAGSRGDAVVATAAGEVVYAGSGLLRYGDFIIIKHNERYLSAYAHNERLLVSEGEQVSRGQKIAEMGSSGISEVRLHFEIREEGKPVDPQRLLPANRP